MKRAGDFTPPTRAERAAAPAALLAIALKAMAAEPAQRYATADALIADMRNWQAGLEVSAYRGSPLERLQRLHHRHGRTFWQWTLAAGVVAALATTLYWEHVKEVATWGQPIAVASFADDAWKRDWVVRDGGFVQRDGHLETTGFWANLLCYTPQLVGNTAIEYDGEILPGAHPGDLSLYWSREPMRTVAGRPVYDPQQTYKIRVGTYDGSYSAIIHALNEQHLGYSDFGTRAGARYHVRIEITGEHITLSVNGRRLCQSPSADHIPLSSGYIALYGYYAGKAFSNLRIYTLGSPLKVVVTAIGDAFMQQQDYAEAERQFQKVASSHPGTAIGQEAIFKQGLACVRQGHGVQALALWSSLSDRHYADLAGVQRLELDFAEGAHQRLLASMREIHARCDAEIRTAIAWQWARCVRLMDKDQRAAWLARYLRVHDEVFPDQSTADRTAADALLMLQRYEEMLARYPQQQCSAVIALQRLGRSADVITLYPSQLGARAQALYFCGRSDEIIPADASGDGWDEYWRGLIARGHAEEVLARRPGYAPALCALGRLEEAIALSGAGTWDAMHARLLLGRENEITAAAGAESMEVLMAKGLGERAVQLHGDDDVLSMWPRHLLGLQACMRGDLAKAEQLFTVLDGCTFHQFNFDFAHFTMVPFLRELGGVNGALDQACAEIVEQGMVTYEQRPLYRARFLLGQIGSAAFLAQPHLLYAPAELLLCQAINAERAKHPVEAVAAYRAWLALPAYRRGQDCDPVPVTFVRWRISVLSPQP